MDIFDASFYWGRITRQTAEEVLKKTDLNNGLYLVREKLEEAGIYVITLCFSKKFYHYRIDRLLNGNVALNGSRIQEKLSFNAYDVNRHQSEGNSVQMKFSGPMDLIAYHQKTAEPLITQLLIPCKRPCNHNFIHFWCLPLLTPQLYVHKIFQEASNTDFQIPMKEKLTVKRYIYERRVLKTLHENESWFHSRISRQEAETRLKNAGLKNGLFLIREKAINTSSYGSYSLSLCYRGEYRHYIIQHTSNGYLQVTWANMSPCINQFGSIAHLVDFYYQYHQDLAYPLRYPCARLGGSVQIVPYQEFLQDYGSEETEIDERWSSTPPVSRDLTSSLVLDTNARVSSSSAKLNHNDTSSFIENFFIDEKYLKFGEKLGEGQFGEVYIGELTENDNGIIKSEPKQVAIKQLRQKHGSFVRELYKEGERMLDLDHPCIVKIFGVCKRDTGVSLVLELCPYGAMNCWLKANKTFRMSYILNYMYQVSTGMSYLREKNIIHRDLALRNILIMSRTVCKISDFGLSRDLEDNIYHSSGKSRPLPSLWYPPEVLERFLFHSEIDIWSFGVAVWEATSYGQTPYRKELEAMKHLTFDPVSKKLLKFLADGNRLKRPSNCPNDIYELMLKCWEYDKRMRPTFAWIKQYLSTYAFPQDQ